MSIRGRKPKKGSLGTSFIIEKIPGLKRSDPPRLRRGSDDGDLRDSARHRPRA